MAAETKRYFDDSDIYGIQILWTSGRDIDTAGKETDDDTDECIRKALDRAGFAPLSSAGDDAETVDCNDEELKAAVFAGMDAWWEVATEDRKYAVEEIGEGQVAYREYLDSRTPESIAALQAEIAKPHPLSPLLSDLDQWIVDESTRGLGDRGK